MTISFFSEDVSYSIKNRRNIKNWIKSTIKKEGLSIGTINIIITSDDYLIEINQQYLNHNFYTDIITFQNEDSGKVSGDLYISYDRILENATDLGLKPIEELYRVIIHGILHLCGYQDKSKRDKELMTKLEDKYLLNIDVPRGTSN